MRGSRAPLRGVCVPASNSTYHVDVSNMVRVHKKYVRNEDYMHHITYMSICINDEDHMHKHIRNEDCTDMARTQEPHPPTRIHA